MIAGGTRAIETAVKGVQLAEGFGRLAEVMPTVSLVRSMVSKEGDHERGTYLMKTGYRPDPTVEHPSIGAICCHELPAARPTSPGTSRSCRASGRRGAGSSAASSTPSRRATRASKLARRDVARRRRRATLPARSATSTWSSAPSPGAGGGGSTATLHRETIAPRPGDDDVRAAQGVRHHAGARSRSARSTATPRSAAPAWPPAG